MLILTFRPLKVRPPGWRPANTFRPNSPFRAGYDQTLRDLRYELDLLHASEAFVQVEVETAELRQDGLLRAHARPSHPGVIVTAVTRRLGTLTWPAEKFNHWQGNLRAVALGLNHLRTLDRYDIATMGQQYAGFNELGSGTPMGSGAMSLDEAAVLLTQGASGSAWCDVDSAPSHVQMVYREAAKRHHPDAGGDPGLFRRLTEARDLLLGDAT